MTDITENSNCIPGTYQNRVKLEWYRLIKVLWESCIYNCTHLIVFRELQHATGKV